MYPLIDTHTHFDVTEFDHDRAEQSRLAWQNGVQHIVLIGFLARYFNQMVACQNQLAMLSLAPKAHLAFGLHPFYIHHHTDHELHTLEKFIRTYPSVAIGEIGLDTFTDEMKTVESYTRQQDFFINQLALAKTYQLPVLLHIRRAHGDALKILKAQNFKQGGIAHSFSGGIQEAKAFVNLGFKIGVTGQVSNPNAKKLRNTLIELVKTVGLESLVIETDCPDFTPLCRHRHEGRRNVPANLIFVLEALAELLGIEKTQLATQLWHNSLAILNLTE